MRLGPVWALVTPVAVYLQVTDPEAIREIFARPASFVRPVKEYSTSADLRVWPRGKKSLIIATELLEVYGPCISTAGSDDWARHRKILAAPFNENIMKFVWDESLRQAQGMLTSWDSLTTTTTGIPSVQQDLKTLAINVLAATAFKKSSEFRGSAEPQDEGSSYRNTLQTVLDNAILIMLISYRYLRGPFVPKKLVRIGDAARSFKSHMVEMLEEETSALRENRSGSGGIMSSFVRALSVHEREAATSPEITASKDGKRGLSVDEIFGNVFTLNFAGYDTTAHTLGFALYLLAIHPEVQDWLAEEIAAAVVAGRPQDDIQAWDYQSLFPRLRRCRVILLETLRVFPPIVGIPKWTAAQPQPLTVPAGVYTAPHLSAVHAHPHYWDEGGGLEAPRGGSSTPRLPAATTPAGRTRPRCRRGRRVLAWRARCCVSPLPTPTSRGRTARRAARARSSSRSRRWRCWRACSRAIGCRCSRGTGRVTGQRGRGLWIVSTL